MFMRSKKYYCNMTKRLGLTILLKIYVSQKSHSAKSTHTDGYEFSQTWFSLK